MATVAIRTLACVALATACDDLEGFEGEVTPLATIRFEVSGDFEAVRVPGATAENLRVALVWGAQWLPEPVCFLPAESPEAATAIAAGCRDILGFVPDRTIESVALDVGEIQIFALPSADVMVGDVTARIAYASLVVFDDRDNEDGLQRLNLGRSESNVDTVDDPDPAPEPLTRDIVYGASFVSMTEPDTRLVLREGGYNERAAFYPRAGCGTPPAGFSIATAGGFSREAAIAATLAGLLPQQDPATCTESSTEDTIVPISFRAAPEVAEIGCIGRRSDSSVRYRQPPIEPLDLTNRVTACASVPDFGMGSAEQIQLLVSTRSDARCKGLVHYTLRGCHEDAACVQPEWDITANPPPWWPCP